MHEEQKGGRGKRRGQFHDTFALNAGIGQFQQRTEPRHPAVYWPGLQGLVSDPLGWRARLHTREFSFPTRCMFAYHHGYTFTVSDLLKQRLFVTFCK